MSAGISAAGWVAIGGATAGALSSKGGKGSSSTTQNQMDPRMDPYVFGSEDGQTEGILQIASDLFNSNRSGLNDQMRQGLNSQWATYTNPNNMAGYQQMAQLGSGLMSAPVMGNPFADGRSALYTGAAQAGAGSNLDMGGAPNGAKPPVSYTANPMPIGAAPGPFTAPPPAPATPPAAAPAQAPYTLDPWRDANLYPGSNTAMKDQTDAFGKVGWAWDGNQWLRPGYGGNGA